MSDPHFDALEARLGLASGLRAALLGAPEPAGALARAARVLEAAHAADADRLARALGGAPEALARTLRALCGLAPFFVPRLEREPERLFALLEDDLRVPRRPADLEARLEAALAGVAPSDAADALRRFKYVELARITVREASEDLVPTERVGETLAELSHLADALLARALAVAGLAERDIPAGGAGLGAQARPLRFCVLGLGKLGSEELNYSSDVDLVYVFEGAAQAGPASGDPEGVAPAEHFSRLARGFGRLVADVTDERFLYRVDLDLRPEGGQGSLVVSSEALVEYFDTRAATWEKAAFMKARPVAGELGFGWSVVRSLGPILYRSAMDLEGVASIREMKRRIEQEKGRSGQDFDVKLGEGGIRDIEFIVQSLQLLHGGRVPQLRGRSTQGGIAALADAGVLPRDEAEGLLASYRWLRRLENRLQMREERQTHLVPAQAGAREWLARALGYAGEPGVACFERDLAEHRRRVRSFFEALLLPAGGERILDLFVRHVPGLLRIPSARALLEEMAGQFARELALSASPERATNNLDRFIEGVGSRTSYYGLLIDRPELVPRLVALFATSNYLSALFASQPGLIEPVFHDPNVLILSRAELEADFSAIRRAAEAEGGSAPGLCALRRFRHRQIVNVGLLDLGGKIGLAEAEAALTEIAEVCLERALEVAAEQIGRRPEGVPQAARAAEFLVVGMGKLGSRELGYGSDLDVIFLYDVAPAAAGERATLQEHFVRLSQKTIWALQTPTAEGFCYAVDPRLRPSGQQGMLVTSLASFESYHAESAQVWERQALLRARPVAGSARLAALFEARRREILCRPLPGDVVAELHRIRQRSEAELARAGASRRDFKLGRGGLLEVETVVQWLQLRHGSARPELFDAAPLALQIDRLEALAALGAEPARALREGWGFLRQLSSRLRIVENRSISHLDEERGDLDAIARSLGYPPAQGTGGARGRLIADFRRHTEAIRGVYLAVLASAAD